MKLLKSFMALCLALIMVMSMGQAAFAYNDVSSESESLAAIEFVDKMGILPSTWTGDFKPDQDLTRADAIAAIYKMLHKDEINPADYETVSLDFVGEEYGNVKDGSLLKAYLCWAVDNFLVATNTEDGKFYPSQGITANELLTLLAKVLCLVEEGDEYPDDIVSKMDDIDTGLMSGDDVVSREQGAVAIAAALVSSEGMGVELGTFVDDEGEPIVSLASQVYNMSKADLVIRATKQKPLGYTVKNDLLLSNGADIELKDDLSEYVGYGISVIYCDADKSGTYTEDEKLLSYSVSSTVCSTVPASKLIIESGNIASADTEDGTISFSTSTYLYLNDMPWPVNDPSYDLSANVLSLNTTVLTILNRPNLTFKVLKAGESEVAISVFAYEPKPGKIVGVNNGIYSIYDYYCAGRSDVIKHFNVKDCEFSGNVKVGDFVSFYESNGTCYIGQGTAVVSAVKKIENVEVTYLAPNATKAEVVANLPQYTFADDSTHFEHVFFTPGDCSVKVSTNYDEYADEPQAPETLEPKYTFITDGTEESCIVSYEAYQANYANLVVEALSVVGKNTFITAKNTKTGKSVEFKVANANINSTTEVKVGDVITYSDNDVKNAPDAKPEDIKPLVTYVKKTADVTSTFVYDAYAKTFTDVATGTVYYINQSFVGNLGTGAALSSGNTATVTLKLDMANTVVAYVNN